MRKKADVLNAFFDSDFKLPSGYSAPTLKDRDQKQNSPHKLRGNDQQPEIPLRHTQVSGAEWDQPEGSEDAGGSSQRATFHLLPAVLTTK